MEQNRSTNRILIVALALGVAADLLFNGHLLGLSVPAFTLLALVGLYSLGRQQGLRPVRGNLWLVLPLLFCAAMVAVRANPFVTVLNMAACFGLLGLVAFFYGGGRVESLGLLGYPLAWLRASGSAAYRAGPLLADALQRQGASQDTRRRLAPVARGLLLALPVVAVFTCLLSSADLVFGRYVGDVFHLRFWQDLFSHGVTIAFMAWVLAGGLAYALGRAAQRDEPEFTDRMLDSLAGSLSKDDPPEGDTPLERVLAALARLLSLGVVEAGIILGAVDFLFLLFVGIQFAYLFGGAANISAQGFTYAEYVHRGFGELVAVAALTLGLILGLQWLTRRRTRGEERTFKGLGSLMVALSLVILASGFQRMRLYEQAYGYTELRLYVYLFMAWLGVVFLWFLASLWWRPQRFAIGAFVAALGFVVVLNLINPDAFIARENLARYRATGKLDAHYLTTLSWDATPALIAGLPDVTGEERQILQEDLDRRLELMAHNQAWQGWPSANLARWQAYYSLMGN